MYKTSNSQPFRVWEAPSNKIEYKLSYSEDLSNLKFWGALDECLGINCGHRSNGWEPLFYADKVSAVSIK